MQVELSLSTSDDETEIRQYYRGHPHQHYAFREALTKVTAQKGDFIVIRKDGEIVGCSGLFVHRSITGKVYVETGQMRVTLNGFSLFKCLRRINLLKFFADHQHADIIFSQVDETNTQSLRGAQAIGLVPFQPDDDLRKLATNALPPDKREDALGVETIYLTFPRQNLGALRSYFVTHMRNNVITENGRAGKIEIALTDNAIDLFERSLPALAELDARS